MEAARSTDLVMHGYVCSRPVLWILGSFWSQSWPPKCEAGRLLTTCSTYMWLDSLVGQRLLKSALYASKSVAHSANPSFANEILECIAHSANPSFAQRNPRMVQIQTLRITYIHVHVCWGPASNLDIMGRMANSMLMIFNLTRWYIGSTFKARQNMVSYHLKVPYIASRERV